MSIAIFSAGIAFLATGETLAGTGALVCRAEADKFCQNVPYGQGRRLACLANHQSELSPECKKKLTIMQQVFDSAQVQLKKNDAAIAKLAAKPPAKQNGAQPGTVAPKDPGQPPAAPAH